MTLTMKYIYNYNINAWASARCRVLLYKALLRLYNLNKMQIPQPQIDTLVFYCDTYHQLACHFWYRQIIPPLVIQNMRFKRHCYPFRLL